MYPFQCKLHDFACDERGTVMAEAMMVLPVLIWSYLALFVYWDSYRSVNTMQKAAYTVSDMISRENVAISNDYIPGMRDVMQYLINDRSDVNLRVTSVTYSEVDAEFQVHWSRSPGNAMPELTTADLQQFLDCDDPNDLDFCLIPNMADGDYVVIVEVNTRYVPAFNVSGLGETVLSQFIVTRPRFLTRICLPGTCV